MKKKNLLIISAHADDNVSCAGTVFKLSQEFGFTAYEAVLTNSQLGQSFKNKKEKKKNLVARVRFKELKIASKYLGIKKTFQFGKPDLSLEYSQEITFKLAKIIRKVKPEVIFLHNPYDAHPDHKTSYKIGLDSIKIAAMGVEKEKLGTPYRVPIVLCSEGMLPVKTQILVDITKYQKKKERLFKLYSSQASPKALKFEKGLSMVRGYQLKKDKSFYAEAFTLQEEFPILFFEENE
ncbi:hypothetical protein A2686_02745 [Candidatus Woesebacteria bacterium RIFCSPHIGHO2_01_FULL_38_10]|uniref:GlcNAc-PI de-N-acetylase n=1 Tax=Candidatus Woesebacteria bacterium RIFCSPLOWO2_01_FULL_39_10b TaxID=1802517 RepID=A0A1F8B8X2_9BACT|nr:MAG: hypothetical protein A2686_02745 [Candidatus Woesebacteria bacterium RIFCSPHIGHO2_01_FULL_38_10]OGM60483.1 MAG: hypothetical protein A2892_00440 [Candidatus Woesebacteria bacterium RIFCSPLOWO2_01_FULL_39_10b]